MAGISLVVADMAGTTIEDPGIVLRCFLSAAERHRVPVTAEEVNRHMGASKLEVFRMLAARALGDGPRARERALESYETFERCLGRIYREEPVHEIAGARETFRVLGARGVKIALITGFHKRTKDLLLERLGWNHGAVDLTVCADDVPAGRPAPYMVHQAMRVLACRSVHEVLKVGDTPNDLLEGHNAGARANVGVTSGAHTREELSRHPHTHLLGSVAELPQLIDRELGWP